MARAIFSFPAARWVRAAGKGGRSCPLCALWAGSPEVVVGHDKWAEMATKDHV